MAIRFSDYECWVENIKIHKKDHRRFLFDFRIEGKQKRRVYTVKNKTLNKNDCKKEARAAFLKVYEKEKLLAGSNLDDRTKIDDIFAEYTKSLKATGWTRRKESFYETYLSPRIGKMKIGTVKELHITRIIKELEKEGLKPRTVRTTIEILKPMFEWSIRNNIITTNPAQFIFVKVPSQKKIVTNATDKFKKIFEGINEYYKDNPFLRALFLFGFTGRRKSEILNLKWENVDLINGYYWIEDTKNGEKQKYPLPSFIKTPLEEIKDNRTGLVFKSPVTGLKIKNTDRQMNQLKKFLNMPELTLHYMRNIIVSSLAEQGIEAVYLSGILGHRDINTINKYLSNNHFKSGEIGLSKIDDILDAEVV